MGPWTYARHLMSAPRLPFTAAYFGSIALTLYFAIGVSPLSYPCGPGLREDTLCRPRKGDALFIYRLLVLVLFCFVFCFLFSLIFLKGKRSGSKGFFLVIY